MPTFLRTTSRRAMLEPASLLMQQAFSSHRGLPSSAAPRTHHAREFTGFKAALSLISILTAWLSPVWADPPSQAELERRVDEAAQKFLDQPMAAGLSIAIGRDGKVILAKGYGHADLEHDIPVSPDSIFRIGSVTKQFTAAGIMKLAERGKLALDDPLSKHLPDYAGPAARVTIRQLLNHTGGVWSYTNDGAFINREASLELTTEEVIAIFREKPLEFEPGTDADYSNSGYYLLGEVIRAASGIAYPDFVTRELLKPAGLTAVRYESNREIIPNRARGYSSFDARRSNARPLGAHVPGAAGSLVSTASELVRWTYALAGGRIVSPESYAAMTTPPEIPGQPPQTYAMGLVVDRWEGRRRVSHDGGIFGYASTLVHLPDDTVVVAVLSNSDVLTMDNITDELCSAAVGIELQPIKDLPIDDSARAALVGTYALQGTSKDITIIDENGKLWAQATEQPKFRLLSQGGREFRVEFDRRVKLVFDVAEQGARCAGFTLHQGGERRAIRKEPHNP